MSKEYHLGKNGPSICKATKNNCPLGGEHYKSMKEAEAAYAETLNTEVISSIKKELKYSYTQELLKHGSSKYPQKILIQLGEYIESNNYNALAIVPAGSDLYNTKIPGKPVHDYDFTVFVTPESSKRKSYQHLSGELDVNVIRIDKILEMSERSAPITESLYAYHNNRALLTKEDPQWGPYLKGLRLSTNKYFNTVDRTMRNMAFEEPVSKDDKKNFANFKHSVRWSIYHKRWGIDDSKTFDPRLSVDERRLFLKAIDTGSIKPIIES